LAEIEARDRAGVLLWPRMRFRHLVNKPLALDGEQRAE
jgi:hypothetical protein